MRGLLDILLDAFTVPGNDEDDVSNLCHNLCCSILRIKSESFLNHADGLVVLYAATSI